MDAQGRPAAIHATLRNTRQRRHISGWTAARPRGHSEPKQEDTQQNRTPAGSQPDRRFTPLGMDRQKRSNPQERSLPVRHPSRILQQWQERPGSNIRPEVATLRITSQRYIFILSAEHTGRPSLRNGPCWQAPRTAPAAWTWKRQARFRPEAAAQSIYAKRRPNQASSFFSIHSKPVLAVKHHAIGNKLLSLFLRDHTQPPSMHITRAVAAAKRTRLLAADPAGATDMGILSFAGHSDPRLLNFRQFSTIRFAMA